MNHQKLLIISATRVASAAFDTSTPLGRSLRRLSFDERLGARVAMNNSAGLPAIYNRHICEENRDKILLFVHDDVWLDDVFIYQRLKEALEVFEIVGLAGNMRRLPRQPAWGFTSEEPFIADDRRYFSGVVANGDEPCGKPARYGPPGRACLILDGVFLAARCQTLLDSGLRFDERFMFHFYDIDFCRSAEQADLKMGTWPIAVTHASFGEFDSPMWRAGLQVYREKWEGREEIREPFVRQVAEVTSRPESAKTPQADLRFSNGIHHPKVLIVSASRAAPAAFESSTLLGRSLRRLSYDNRLEARVAVDNRAGLPAIYNRQICEENLEKILLFVHDDVWLDDCFIYERLLDALDVFDVVGVAGNIRRLPGQPAWAFTTEQPFTWDDSKYLSGTVAHGDQPGGELNFYGMPGQSCRLLDGVFLAARCRTLLRAGVRFDERFMFDFYDVDFCRSAEAAKLTIGTWPIAITHNSVGKFGAPEWHAGLRAYRAKWGESEISEHHPNLDEETRKATAAVVAKFQQAFAHHQRGELEHADTSYQELLVQAPDHFDALHLRGVILHQQGRNDLALELIQQALELNAGEAAAHSNHGLVLQALGKPEDAIASYDRALFLKPDFAAAHFNRGNALMSLRRCGQALESYDHAIALTPRYAEALNGRGNALCGLHRNDEALESLERALAISPEYPEALLNRGVALSGLRRHAEALASYDRALALRPDYAEAFSNRGGALTCLKRHEEALTSFNRSLALNPDYVDALINLGAALNQLKRPQEALSSLDRALALDPEKIGALVNRAAALVDMKLPRAALESLDRALELRPDHIEALINRGNALRDLERFEEALASLARVLEIAPGEVEALVNRGAVLRAMRRPDEALSSLERALALEPDRASALNGAGNALADLKRPDEAVAMYERALSLEPDFFEALLNRGAALRELGRPHESARSYARLLAIDPEYPYARGYAFHSQLHACDWTNYAETAKRIEDAAGGGRRVDAPFSFLALSHSVASQLRCAQTWVDDKCRPAADPIWTGTRYRHNQIRVAYLSADFHTHATAHLMAELFETHDRSRFEVSGISFGPDDPGGMRERLQGAFDRFVDVRGRSDREVAQMLVDMEIDVAIDLKGFTQHSRPSTFAQRAAPVQVNYLGYPGTMGAGYIDYIIADACVIPFEHEPFYAEKVVRMPDTYQVNDRTRAIASRIPTRAEADLPPTGFVFCCFNNNFKITPPVFDIWMRLLARVEGSVLWLLEDNADACGNLRREASLRGISAERIVFAARIPLADHLARHRLADLFIDTLPYNAHTTASDALWAGLPVLTCMGSTFVGRVAASLLHAVGLPELVTHSLADYEALALRLASAPGLLSDLKARLARNRSTHALFDTDRFRRHLEQAYLRMHERSQQGLPPEGFAVQAIA